MPRSILTQCCALLLLMQLWTFAAEDTQAVRFIQITDSHIGDANHDWTPQLTRLIHTMKTRAPDASCIIHTGDITAERTKNKKVVRATQALLNTPGLPVHYVAGNNDIFLHNKKPIAEAYRTAFGPLAYAREYNGVVFLMVCVEPLAQEIAIADYDPLGWLEEALIAAGDKPVILAIHSPPTGDLFNDLLHKPWPPRARLAFSDLVNKYKVKAIIAGHFHREATKKMGAVPVYIAGSVAEFLGESATYRIYTYKNGTLTYETISDPQSEKKPVNKEPVLSAQPAAAVSENLPDTERIMWDKHLDGKEIYCRIEKEGVKLPNTQATEPAALVAYLDKQTPASLAHGVFLHDARNIDAFADWLDPVEAWCRKRGVDLFYYMQPTCCDENGRKLRWVVRRVNTPYWAHEMVFNEENFRHFIVGEADTPIALPDERGFDISQLRGQTVRVRGASGNAKAGAVVESNHMVIYLDALDAWPDTVIPTGSRGKQVEVTGRLVEKIHPPRPKGEGVAYVAGMEGTQWILLAPKWTVVEE